MTQLNLPKFCLASIFLTLFCSFQATQGQDDPPIKVNTVLLNIPVIVSGRDGSNIVGLRAEDFTVTSGGQIQQIDFFSDAEMPLSVAIALDVSGSVTGVFGGIKKAAKDFVDRLGPNDKGTVVTFGEKIKLLQRLTPDKGKLKNTLSGAGKDQGGVALMNAALLSILDGELGQVKGRKAIIVITDAGEINDHTTRGLRDKLIENDAVVYPIYFPTASPWFPRGGKATMEHLIKETPVGMLNDIAELTGGRLLLAENDDFGPQFQRITDELKKMYVIGFHPEVDENGRPNPVSITVKLDGAVVRTKSTMRVKPIRETP